MGNKSRILELDVLRGIAAFYVLCFHYVYYYGDHLNTDVPTLSALITGIYGVQLFFMISGYVIFMTLEKTKRPMDFIVSRFSRLFPGYWIAVILAFALIRFFPLTEEWVPLRRAVANLFMIQSWLEVKHIEGVYWTLSIELAFYTGMFFLYLMKKFKYVELLGLLWLVLMALRSRMEFYTTEFLDIENLLRYGHLFFAGILFYQIRTKGATWYRYACLGMCLLVQYIAKIPIHHGNFIDPALGTFIIFLFFATFQLLISDKLFFIGIKPFVYLGTVSYSLYLTHASVSSPVLEYLYAKNVGIAAMFLIACACSLLTATVITYGVEKPAMAYIRNTYKKWQSAKTQESR